MSRDSHRVVILFLITLMWVGFSTCKKKLATPEYDSPYDETSENYIPTPDLNTSEVTFVRALSARSGGQFQNEYGKPVTAKGVCWSLTPNPTIESSCSSDGSATTNFASNLTGLLPDTLYYVRAYATNEAGTIYGGQRSFRTWNGVVRFSEVSVIGIRAKSASSSGNASDDGGAAITRKGFVWSTQMDPTLEDSVAFIGAGLGSFSYVVHNLRPGTQYHLRAFAENAARVSYSTNIKFTTPNGESTFSGLTITNVTSSSASVAAIVDQDGGDAITARGVCYSKVPDSTTAGTCIASGSGTGAVSVAITGLDRATAYYVRPYATNAVMTSYGPQVSFVTLAVLPTVTTGTVSEVGATTATVTGEVTSDGGSPQTTRGVCFATTQNPTILGTCVAAGTGAGTFESSLSGLAMGTTYYARSYATNAIGTVYGSQVSFTTLTGPMITTDAISNITSTSSTVSGTVISDGGFPVLVRGVCYSTTQSPSTTGNCVESGSGTGSFLANLTGLTRGTTYYVRAFATNEVATSYGHQIIFFTLDLPSVTTVSITNITSSTANVTGNVTSDGGQTVTERGFCFGTTQNPTTSDRCVTSGSGVGTFSGDLTGLTNATIYYVRAYAINSVGKSFGIETSFSTSQTNSETVTDIDGNVYPTVQIGTQIWMAANLRTTRYRTGATITNVTNATTWAGLTTGAWAHYGNNSVNEMVYGKLYNWYAVADSRNICPTGWHVPSDAEWTVLSNFLGTDVGFKMKSTSGWQDNGNGSNASGFNGLPGGYRAYDGFFYSIGLNSHFWSSTHVGDNDSWYRYMVRNDRILGRDSFVKQLGFSVRCVRD